MAIPTLDASYFLDNSLNRSTFPQALLASLKSHGFVKLINHGIPHELIGEVFQLVRYLTSQLIIMLIRKQSKKFFDLPPESKEVIAHTPGPDPQRGWSRVGSEKTSAVYEKIARCGAPPTNSADAKVTNRLIPQIREKK